MPVAPLNFPASPSPGDIWDEGGFRYVFRTAPPRWDLIGPTPGAAGGRFEHAYSGPVWTVGHNLGERYVSVQCVDSAGNLIIGDPAYTSTAVVTLTFSESVTGTAVVRT